jgi:hypothetical protein
LAGVPAAQLIVHNFLDDSCLWEAGTEEGIPLETSNARAVHVVDETLAYQLLREGLLTFWDGESWSPYPLEPISYDVSLVWGDRSSVFVAGRDGLIMSEVDGDWQVHDTGTMEMIRSLWGFAGNDVWAGTNDGRLLHWNGDVWEDIEWPDSGESPDSGTCLRRGESINGMWGTDGILFFHTYTQFVMWDGAEFVVLGYWPGEYTELSDGEYGCENRLQITGIWGNSPEEVFLSIENTELYEGDCGREFLLWWDGSEFHWF